MKKFLLLAAFLLVVLGLIVWIHSLKIEGISQSRIPSFMETNAETLQIIEKTPDRKIDFRETIEKTIAIQLRDFRRLSSKVLLSKDEKKEIQTQLQDLDMIRKSYLILIEPIISTQELPSNEATRLMALDFLEKGIEWLDNPAREEVVESLKNVILLDNLAGISDLSIRKSYAGDKVEATLILKEHAPQALNFIDSLPEDGRIRRLIQYAEKLFNQQ